MLAPCVWGLQSWRSKTVDLCYLANRVRSTARARGRVSKRERARWLARWKEMHNPIITHTFKLSMLEPLASIIKSNNWTFTKLHLKLKLTANAGKWLKSLFPTTNVAFPVGCPTTWSFTSTLNVACVLKAKLNFDLQMVAQKKESTSSRVNGNLNFSC